MKPIGRVGILGSGSWATALAKIVLTSQPHINWYVRRSEQVKGFLKLGHNPNYLPAAEFDTDNITFFSESDINSFFRASDTIVLVTPSPYAKSYLKKVRKSSMRDKLIVNAIKGIVPDENMLVSDYLMEEAFAEVLRNDFVNCVTTNDVVGVQYASVLKNIYAIAAGICNGLQYGDNFQSVLISNAIAEMNNFVNAVHLIDREITDSVYLGDLLVTAYSQFSRNRTFGNMIGRGYSVKAAQTEMEMIAEGYFGAKCVREVNARYQVNIPICDMVYEILYEKKNATEAILELSKHFK